MLAKQEGLFIDTKENKPWYCRAQLSYPLSPKMIYYQQHVLDLKIKCDEIFWAQVSSCYEKWEENFTRADADNGAIYMTVRIGQNPNVCNHPLRITIDQHDPLWSLVICCILQDHGWSLSLEHKYVHDQHIHCRDHHSPFHTCKSQSWWSLWSRWSAPYEKKNDCLHTSIVITMILVDASARPNEGSDGLTRARHDDDREVVDLLDFEFSISAVVRRALAQWTELPKVVRWIHDRWDVARRGPFAIHIPDAEDSASSEEDIPGTVYTGY